MSQKSFDPEEASEYNFPAEIPPPLFAIGTYVRWNSQSGGRGLVLGMRYIWGKHSQAWQYQYYVALNPHSLSYQWTKFDWGWQEDLAIIPTSDSLFDNENRND